MPAASPRQSAARPLNPHGRSPPWFRKAPRLFSGDEERPATRTFQDPDPSQRRARRAGGGLAGRRSRAAARRPAGRSHRPQPEDTASSSASQSRSGPPPQARAPARWRSIPPFQFFQSRQAVSVRRQRPSLPVTRARARHGSVLRSGPMRPRGTSGKEADMSDPGSSRCSWRSSVAGAALVATLCRSTSRRARKAGIGRIENRLHAERHPLAANRNRPRVGVSPPMERWNAGFIRLSAPTADQFLQGGFQLATLIKPAPKSAIGAPVVLASAHVEPASAASTITNDGDDALSQQPPAAVAPPAPSAGDMLHVASYERPPAPSRSTVSRSSRSFKARGKGPKIDSADALAPLPATDWLRNANTDRLQRLAIHEDQGSGSPR